MGLIDVVARVAASRAHVLVAEAPGAFRQRVALERAMDRLGWCAAGSVADADVLAVVGDPGEALTAVVEHVWAQMSEPRARLQVRDAVGVDVLLGETRDRLRDGARRLTGPDLRRGFTPSVAAPADDHAAGDHHGDHGAMTPDGIALAEGAEDRDGLEMDQLHLPLGPVLGHWPAGLVLRATLRGDIVAEAAAEWLPAAVTYDGFETEGSPTRAARLLDAAAAVLTLAGLPAESARVRGLRDRCLDGEPVAGGEVAVLADRLGRQRLLPWLLDGLPASGPSDGDQTLHDRLTGLFDRARAELDGETTSAASTDVAALPGLVCGRELASVRLWLAALSPDLAEPVASESAGG